MVKRGNSSSKFSKMEMENGRWKSEKIKYGDVHENLRNLLSVSKNLSL